ncbi:MAG: hypothetical protein A2506_11025 [Elusimicrobia bacterium RIFOXYD12_FULL_66_9]|nr:MAG: hypothetical protein A2506_11025 [Elusimicrobia bacterium RIFOXYD12_FULL_66_9]
MNKLLALTVILAAVPASAEIGLAKVKGTTEGSPIAGTVSFEDTAKGLKLSVSVSGLTSGAHGFHIHEWGDCADEGKTAGGHYNPAQAAHGDALKHGPRKVHAGDTGNLIAGEDGRAVLEALLPGVKLTGGKFTVAGRAVIIHEKADDFSQPAGNAGTRVACGIIGLVPGHKTAPK